jgi:hypothetical protein
MIRIVRVGYSCAQAEAIAAIEMAMSAEMAAVREVPLIMSAPWCEDSPEA